MSEFEILHKNDAGLSCQFPEHNCVQNKEWALSVLRERP